MVGVYVGGGGVGTGKEGSLVRRSSKSLAFSENKRFNVDEENKKSKQVPEYED